MENSFEGVYKKMSSRMSELYSGKRDTSYQDPGETLIELFSLLIDMQNDYMHYLGNNEYSYFRKLLDEEININKYESKFVEISYNNVKSENSSLYALNSKEILNLPKKYLFEGEGLQNFDEIMYQKDLEDKVGYQKPYETMEEFQISKNKIKKMIQSNDTIMIGFEYDISQCPVNKIYVRMEQEVELPKDFISMGILYGEYMNDSRKVWEPFHVFIDNTKGFAISEFIHIYIEEKMHHFIYEDNNLYWIRLSLIQCKYEIIPSIRNIKLNIVQALCRETVCEKNLLENASNYILKTTNVQYYKSYAKNKDFYVENMIVNKDNAYDINVLYKTWYYGKHIYSTDGTPNQVIPIDLDYVIPESVHILVSYQLPESKETLWKEWKRVDSFLTSGPKDEHFIVKDDAICFGNHENGDIPPKGEFRIIDAILSESFIKNKKNLLSHIKEISIDLYQSEKAVTLEDYIRITNEIHKKLPFINIDQAGAVFDKKTGAVIVLVKIKSKDSFPILNNAYRQNIRNYLEPYRMITTELLVESAVYCGLILAISICGKGDWKLVVERTKERIYEYFPSMDFNNRRQRLFGETIKQSELYEILGHMEWVVKFDIVHMYCEMACIIAEGIRLPYNGLVFIKEINILKQV